MTMHPRAPQKTLADYMVIAISPVLIILLVGSLSFFLIEVFYRSPAAGSVRWVLFWFVIAVVLVSRIGIEQGSGYAMAYGLALGCATWIYLTRIHPAWLIGLLLLGAVWWCANRLTRDCTLIDDDEDASGNGLLDVAGRRRKKEKDPGSAPQPKQSAQNARVADKKRHSGALPHAPGLSVVYFSLAALPLFGVGQMLLPSDDMASRRAGFAFLFVYLIAAIGLLLTTSFLGLRRYLRQRHLQMPASIAWGWITFGSGVAIVVMITALLLPRPGAADAWLVLRYQIDYRLRQASEYAARFNPPGEGEGREGRSQRQQDESTDPTGTKSKEPSDQAATPTEEDQRTTAYDQNARDQKQASRQSDSIESPSGTAAGWYRLLQILLLLVLIIVSAWWLFRHRRLIGQMIREFLAAIATFFRTLFSFGWTRKRSSTKASAEPPLALRPFASYENPFITGQAGSWPPRELILYSYQALQAWAAEQGLAMREQQTAREFCADLTERFPEISSELDRLSRLYAHAAFGPRLPDNCEIDALQRLWRFLSDSVVTPAA